MKKTYAVALIAALAVMILLAGCSRKESAKPAETATSEAATPAETSAAVEQVPASELGVDESSIEVDDNPDIGVDELDLPTEE